MTAKMLGFVDRRFTYADAETMPEMAENRSGRRQRFVMNIVACLEVR